MTMQSASVVQLKTRLGHYIGLVDRGETVIVTSHRHPVARLTRATDAGGSPIETPDRPLSDLEGLTPIRLRMPVDGLTELLRDRGRR